MCVTDKGVLNLKEWKGSNWLGVIVTKVRDELLKVDKKFRTINMYVFLGNLAVAIFKYINIIRYLSD